MTYYHTHHNHSKAKAITIGEDKKCGGGGLPPVEKRTLREIFDDVTLPLRRKAKQKIRDALHSSNNDAEKEQLTQTLGTITEGGVKGFWIAFKNG